MARAETGRGSGNRFWLYAPFVALSLVAAAWLVVRGRAEEAFDRWLAREAGAGRPWTCADRRIGGYPFRVELDCASVALNRGEWSLSLGRVRALVQVYQPRHLIAEIEGPLRFGDGRLVVEGEWKLLRTSLRLSAEGLGRASLDVGEPRLRATGLPTGELAVASRRLALHARPNPTRGETEGAYDVALSAAGATIPGLDGLIGGAEPADIGADAVVTRLAGLGPGSGAALAERWRMAGGGVEVASASVVKGPRRLEARGDLRLDEERRPAGRFDLSASGVEGALGALNERLAGAGAAILGALGGGRRPDRPQGAEERAQGLRPLATVRLDRGRVLVGPVTLPGLRLPQLY